MVRFGGLNERQAAFAPPSPFQEGRQLNFNRSGLSVRGTPSVRRATKFSGPFPGRPIKTRSMTAMAALLALGRGAETSGAQARALNLGHHTDLAEGDDLPSIAVQRRAERGRVVRAFT